MPDVGECARAEKAIEELGEGRVGRIKWMLLRRHVAGCEACGSHLERMAAVLEALDAMERAQVPEELAALVMARLAEGLIRRSLEPAAEGSHRNLIWVAAAGVGLALAVGLAVLRWALGRHEEPENLATIATA